MSFVEDESCGRDSGGLNDLFITTEEADHLLWSTVLQATKAKDEAKVTIYLFATFGLPTRCH